MAQLTNEWLTGRLMLSMSWERTSWRWDCISFPSWSESSPMAQVELLQTLMQAVLRFSPRTCINSPAADTPPSWRPHPLRVSTHQRKA